MSRGESWGWDMPALLNEKWALVFFLLPFFFFFSVMSSYSGLSCSFLEKQEAIPSFHRQPAFSFLLFHPTRFACWLLILEFNQSWISQADNLLNTNVGVDIFNTSGAQKGPRLMSKRKVFLWHDNRWAFFTFGFTVTSRFHLLAVFCRCWFNYTCTLVQHCRLIQEFIVLVNM